MNTHIAEIVERIVPPHLRQDALVHAMQAQREGRDVAEAMRRFVQKEIQA